MALLYKCRGCNMAPRPEPWRGPCPSCRGYWDCVQLGSESSGETTLGATVDYKPPPRISSGLPDVDRVLGGGIVPGSVVVVTGPPGVGKSTLLLQVADGVAQGARKVLYVSGEQNKDDIQGLAARLGIVNANVIVIGNASEAYKIVAVAEEKRPALLIVDSANVTVCEDVAADEGTSAQMTAVGNLLTGFAKRTKTPIVLTVHVNKAGDLSGPRTLEHLVDDVTRFDPYVDYPEAIGADGRPVNGAANIRVFSSTGKMRNGPSGTLALFEMTPTGLVPSTKSLSVVAP